MKPSDNSDSDISVDDGTPSKRQFKRRRNERDDSADTDAASTLDAAPTAKIPVPRQPAVQQLWRYPKREGYSIDPGNDDGDVDDADEDPDFNIHEAKKNEGDLFYSPSDDEDDAYQNHLKLRSRFQKSKKKRPKTLAASAEFKPCLEYNESAASGVYHDDDNSLSINADAEVDVQQNPHAAVVKPKKARKSRKKPASAPTLPSTENPASLSTSSDTEPSKMTREQRSEAIAVYFKAYKIAKAEKSDDECRFHTVRELVRQGYNRTTVESIVDRLLANNMTLPLPRRTKPSPHATPLHVLTDIRDKFHEYVQMVAEDDLSKVSVRQFARSIGVHLKLVERALQDDELKQRLRQRKVDEEIIHEARRSLIVAKFIEFTGNVRERRNACMRYFCKTPHYAKKTILNACNRFLAYGTVRSHEKNKATVWAGGEINNRKCEVVTPEEAEYLQALNAEHAWLACNLNLNSVQKRPQVLMSATTTTMTSDTSDNSRNNEGRDILAATTARNEALERELQESKNALAMAELRNEQLQQQLYQVHRSVTNAEL